MGTEAARRWLLSAAYAALIALGYVAYATDVHVGTLAVVPILFISYHTRTSISLVTAFAAGIAFGLLDQSPRPLPDVSAT